MTKNLKKNEKPNETSQIYSDRLGELGKIEVIQVSSYKDANFQQWLVETFVDTEKFSGGCYKAANWECIGVTKGRGKNDRFHKNKLNKKFIYVYEFEKGILLPATKKEETREDWASDEFRYAKMPNKAKKKRLISLAHDFYNNPSGNIPECCEGEAKVKGAKEMLKTGRKPADRSDYGIYQTEKNYLIKS